MLTDATLRGLKPRGTDYWLSDDVSARGCGRLVVRVNTGGGVAFYFRYSIRGRRDCLYLGQYDQSGRAGLTLREARARAGEYSRLHQAPESQDVRQWLSARKAESEVLRIKQAEEAAAAAGGTLAMLIRAYIRHLEYSGKSSSREAERLLERHVLRAWPELASMPAREVGYEAVVPVINRLVEAGHGRSALKLRSYLRAAYQVAIDAHTEAGMSGELRAMRIRVNPVAAVGVKSLRRFNRARDRVLTVREVRSYYEALDRLPLRNAIALKLALLLGGQRPAQLLRMRRQDIDLEAGVITLFDGKGRREIPRRHVLPITSATGGMIKSLLVQNGGSDRLFAMADGPSLCAETLSAAVATISRQMVSEGRVAEPFQLRDIRRTCETEFRRMGASSDLCAQIQSHGLGGVQERHYNRYDYLAEKKALLKRWEEVLHDVGHRAADVLTLRQARR